MFYALSLPIIYFGTNNFYYLLEDGDESDNESMLLLSLRLFMLSVSSSLMNGNYKFFLKEGCF